MKKLIIAALSVIILSGCTSSSDANKALTNAGFTNIKITGYSWFECGQDDVFRTGFIATNPQGRKVKGTVCSGWLKGSTIRY